MAQPSVLFPFLDYQESAGHKTSVDGGWPRRFDELVETVGGTIESLDNKAVVFSRENNSNSD